MRKTKKIAVPNLTWSIGQLEAWWDKNGPTYVGNGAKGAYTNKKKVIDIGAYSCIARPTSFGACCGIFEIGGFDFDTDWILAQNACKLVHEIVTDVMPGHGLVATTIFDQKKAVATLKVIGFKIVGSFRNSNTENVVTLWLATV